MIYYTDNDTTLYQGDARVVLAELPKESVDMCVTSPPYWSLRLYEGIEPLLFGGDPECTHGAVEATEEAPVNHGGNPDGPGGRVYEDAYSDTARQRGWAKLEREKDGVGWPNHTGEVPRGGQTCTLCGAWLGHYGLEPTPQMYIEHSMEFLDAIWRVLKKSGTVWWNLGDSWIGSSAGNTQSGNGIQSGRNKEGVDRLYPRQYTAKNGLRAKDMALIPFRFALAAQERGWWVRSVIIWAKNNPMPESVKDRPTDAHEYIFLLSKSARYYWNQDAVREPITTALHGNSRIKRNPDRNDSNEPADRLWGTEIGRNIRSVWTLNTHGTSEAHFATYPVELAQTCIKAGCPPGGVVLDPFAGSGTSLWAAKTLGVKSIGVELSEDYCTLAVERLRQQVLL